MAYALIKVKLIVATGPRSSRPRPWVARLAGLDDRWGFLREFVKGVYDYTYATQKGKNVWVYFALGPGLYEVYYPTSWKHEERYFIIVDEDGIEQKITKSEVIECLKSGC